MSSDLRSAVDQPGGLLPELRCLALLHGAAVVGRFDAVETLCQLARERGATQDRLEETGLQVVAYGGFPRAIETLGLLAAQRGGPAQVGAVETRSGAERAAAGRAVWDRIYADSQEQVLAGLDELVPGFGSWVLQDAYGRILSRPGLDLGERELLAVAALALAALPAPLGSHVRGALRNGFAADAVEDILLRCTVLADAPAEPVIAQAIDRLHRKVYRP